MDPVAAAAVVAPDSNPATTALAVVPEVDAVDRTASEVVTAEAAATGAATTT